MYTDCSARCCHCFRSNVKKLHGTIWKKITISVHSATNIFFIFLSKFPVFFFCVISVVCAPLSFRSFRDNTLLRWPCMVLLYFLRTMNLVIGEVGVHAPAPHRARLSPTVRYPDQYRSASPAAGLPKLTPRTAPRNLRRPKSCYISTVTAAPHHPSVHIPTTWHAHAKLCTQFKRTVCVFFF